MTKNWKTRLVQPDSHAPSGFRSLVAPVCRGSTTLFPAAAAMRDTWDRDAAPYTYGLYGTPTSLELAARVCELEQGFRTFLTPGGQAALALIYMAHVNAGDHVLVPQSIYGPSRDFADGVLRRFGVDVEYYPPTLGAGIELLIRANTRLIWCESPGSLTMEVQDVPAICEVAHRRGLAVALDNTWSAGVHFDALAHGVDVTMQSLTKYVGGHSDLLLGSVTVRDQVGYQRIGGLHYRLGLAVSPDDCSLALRGMQTLAVRLRHVERSALRIARWLARRDEIATILHPAFATCPGHELWRRDFTGSAGVFSVVFDDRYTAKDVFSFIDGLRVFRIGFSWGGVTSLAIPGAGETSRPDYPQAERLVRFNIGLEDVTDLVADLRRGLRCLKT